MQEHGGFSTRPPVGRRGRERRMRSPRRPGAKHADSDGWGARMRAATPRTQVGEGAAPPACAASGPPGAESMRAQAPQPEETERPKRANRRPGGIWPGRAGNGGKRREAAARGQLRGGAAAHRRARGGLHSARARRPANGPRGSFPARPVPRARRAGAGRQDGATGADAPK